MSALAVCAGHARGAVLCNYSDLTSPTLLHQLLYGFTSLGHQAVIVFFVLSGMFVGGTVLQSRERFTLHGYAVSRLTRLWIVLLPALCFTFIIDTITLTYCPTVADGTYYNLWASGPRPDGRYSTSLSTFFGNVFFLQTIVTPVFGTNSPLWSLANEFWYYLLFPLCLIATGYLSSNKNWLRRFTACMAALLVLLWIPLGMLQGFLVWLMGVAAYLTCNRLPISYRPWSLLISVLLFFAALLYSKSIPYQKLLLVPSDFVVGIGFFPLCVVLAKWPRPTESVIGSLTKKFTIASSEPSYSLYAIHFPLVIMIASLVYVPRKMPPDRDGVILYFVLLSLLLLTGAIFWFLFERNTSRVRSAVSRGFARLSPSRR